MSIIVRGMEMPERCLDCPMYDCYNYNCQLYAFGIPARYNRDGSIRPEWCELVELPEKHGRLIDMDKLKADYRMKDDCADCDKELRNKSKSCEYDRIYTKMDFCGWLDDATVVIEAEGVEE